MVTEAQLEWHLTGGVNNTNPFDSLGGAMSSTKIVEGKISNLWDDVTQSEYTEGDEEYRWIALFNNSSDTFNNPHFYFLPKDEYVDIEFSRLAISMIPSLLVNENTRPSEDEIGPEIDSPMPFTKSTEDYLSTMSVSESIPPQGKLFICVRRVIPEDALGEQPPGENRGYILIAEGGTS